MSINEEKLEMWCKQIDKRLDGLEREVDSIGSITSTLMGNYARESCLPEPAEPLIKDEKIRKAVRAWAEACGLSYATYKQASNEFYDPNTRGAFAIKFKLIPVEVYLEDGECYTIAELCGEEE